MEGRSGRWTFFAVGETTSFLNADQIWTMARTVKNLPAMQETWVQSLGQEDPLGEENAIHSSILAWEVPWTEDTGGLQSTGLQRVGQDWVTLFTFHADHGAAEGKPGDTGDMLKQYLSDWGNGLRGTGRGAGLARCGESSLGVKPVHGHQGWLGSIVWKPVKFSSDWLDFLNKIGNKDLRWKNEV